jgi:DNA modification methylase
MPSPTVTPATFTIQQVPIGALHPDPANPRRIDEHELEALTRSLRTWGFVQPVLARREDSTVIGGHQRLVAARRLGVTEVPVIWLDLSTEQARLLNLALNRISGTWDEQLLAHLLADLKAVPDVDLSLSGFDEDELKNLLRSIDQRDKAERVEEFDLDETLEEVSRSPRTQPGDLWQLGEHRLLCGDATRPHDIARVLEGRSATMLFTDPPWNVAIGRDSNPRHRQRKGLANDDLSPDAFAGFLSAFASAVSPHLDGDAYVVLGAAEWPTLDRVLREAGFHWSATVIWVKDSFVLGRSHFHRRYEPIWYGWLKTGTSSFQGRRDLDDVWEIDRPRRSPQHPTMKPPELVERAVAASSAAGDLVLDPFGGAGSALIACERTGRNAAMVELEPRYCDVILARWERFTGNQAELLERAESAAA